MRNRTLRKDYQVRVTEDDGEENVENFSTLKDAEEAFDLAIAKSERSERYAEIELIEVLDQHRCKFPIAI